MAPFVYGHCHAVQDHSLAVPSLSGSHYLGGEVVEPGGRRGERVRLAIEFFSHWTDEPEVYADFPEVAGHFFDTKHTRLG